LAALTLEGLHGYYGKAHIIRDISLTLKEGEVVGIFGRNGVGKTTLLRCIMHLVPTITGTVRLGDRDISADPTNRRVQRGLGYMPQGLRVFSGLSVEENYRVSAHAAPDPVPLEEILALIPELRDLRRRPAGRLSGGQQQLVSLMRSLATNCRVLLMDEPTEGLMPRMVERIADVIRSVQARGIAVILVEQNLALGEAVADRAYIIEKGRIEAEGSFLALKQSGAIERLLGLS